MQPEIAPKSTCSNNSRTMSEYIDHAAMLLN